MSAIVDKEALEQTTWNDDTSDQLFVTWYTKKKSIYFKGTIASGLLSLIQNHLCPSSAHNFFHDGDNSASSGNSCLDCKATCIEIAEMMLEIAMLWSVMHKL